MTATASPRLPHIEQLTPQVFNYARAYVFQLMRGSEPEPTLGEQQLGLWIARAVVRQADRFDRQKTRRLFSALDDYVHGEPTAPSPSFDQLLADLGASVPELGAASAPSGAPPPAVVAPVVAEPVVAEPVVVEPVVAEPVVAEPVAAEPVAAEPVVAEPVVAEPVVAAPVHVHEERVATESVSETHHAAVDEAIAEAMEHAEGAPRADGDSDTNAPGLDVPTTPHIANPVDSAE